MNITWAFMFVISILRCAYVSPLSYRRCAISMKRESVKKINGLNYKPKKENQQAYVNALNGRNNKLIFAVGPAGTGKTLFACNRAIQELKSGFIDKIVITRPIVPVEEDLGFLPGNINKKMDPWVRPVYDIFLEAFSQKEFEAMVHTGVIEISPLAYMRGRTFKHSFIIADEMQNSSPNQMLMLVTRIGVESRMVVTGDLKQSDKGMESGLFDFIKKYRIYRDNQNETSVEFIKLIELNNGDVERSEVVSGVLNMYEFFDNYKKNSIQQQIPVETKKIIPTKTPVIENDAAMIPLNRMSLD
jgi:phosphate starvation-inducible PhoH-like protein